MEMVHFEVYLQVLLAAGLAVVSFCLLLGCFLCWHRRRSRQAADKEAALSPHLTLHDSLVARLGPTPPAAAVPVRQQYEELDGDVLALPSSSAQGCAPCKDNEAAPPCLMRPQAVSELPLHPIKTCLPLRRLSSPAASSLTPQQCPQSHVTLSPVPKLGLVSRTRRALERRCTVTGDSFLCGERRRLTSPVGSPPSYYSALESTTPPEGALPRGFSRPLPQLHFAMLFSPGHRSLTVTVLGLSEAGRRLGGAFVRVSLPPLRPTPVQAPSRRRSLGPELQGQSVVLPVGSAEDLRGCLLKLAVFTRDFSGLRETPLGWLELSCREVDWEPDHTITCTRELHRAKNRLKKSQSSQDSLNQGPRDLGQLFVLLQYQTQAHRIKVMVRKAESLARLGRMPGSLDHYVVINLHQKGVVISTKETKMAKGCNAVWNAPFLFDLPRGDINELNLVLEFNILQGRMFTKSIMLGRVLIGSDAPGEGQGHWREMCSRGQVETARWHIIQAVSRPLGAEP